MPTMKQDAVSRFSSGNIHTKAHAKNIQNTKSNSFQAKIFLEMYTRTASIKSLDDQVSYRMFR